MENIETETNPDSEKENSTISSFEETFPEESIKESNNQNRFREIISIFLPRKGYFITPILLSVNVLIFLLMTICGVNIISPGNESIVFWGANLRGLILHGEFWRLLTSIFLHIGIIHLLMNMYSLIIIGTFLEPLLGKNRFLLLYLVSGIFSSITSIWWNEMTISAGASGAIFGLFGGSIALFATDLLPKDIRMGLLKNSLIIITINLIYGMSRTGIDNSAHIGGLTAGIILGISFYPRLKRKTSIYIKNLPGLACIILLITTVFLFRNIKNYSQEYDKLLNENLLLDAEGLVPYYSGRDTIGGNNILQTLALQESLAYELYTNADYFEKEKLLASLRNSWPNCWKQNLALLDSIPSKNVFLQKYGPSVHNILTKYYLMRKNSYESIYSYIGNKAWELKSSKDLLEHFIEIEKVVWKENEKIYHNLMQESGLPVSVALRIKLKEKFSSLLLKNAEMILKEASGHDDIVAHKLIKNKDEMISLLNQLQKTRALFIE